MSAENANVPNWKQRLMLDLNRDKRKTAILGVLVVVGVFLGMRAIVNRGATAGAEPVSVASVPQAAAAPSASRGAAGLKATGEEIPDGVRSERYVQQMGRSIKRDIFAPNTDFFPPERQVSAVTRDANALATKPVEDERELERQAILAQARAMVLQSTMTSTTPTAVVSGRVLRVGDWINGFQVLDIAPRACTLEKKGVRVTLEMRLEE